MKELMYEQIQTSPFIKSEKIIEELTPKLVRKYGGVDYTYMCIALEKQIPYVMTMCNWDVKGKKILDLGCGAERHPIIDNLGCLREKPWLCRALFELGAYAIGIDFGESPNEEFEFHRLNLLEKNVLDFIPDNSIDLANARLLESSPQISKIYHQMEKSKSIGEVGSVYGILYPQLKRILKPEGCFIHTDKVK